MFMGNPALPDFFHQQKEMLMKFITSAILALTFAFTLSACNTIEGAGEDVEAAGSAIEQEAEENTNY